MLASNMTVDESLKLHGFVPDDATLPAIRKMLADEAANERAGNPREEDLALLCCVQLFSRGLMEDVLRIWEAKCSGMDLGGYLDVEFLCGAGLNETKRFLAEQPSQEAAQALAYINEWQVGGQFDDFSPQEHLEHYRRYFEIA
jgi:hypothetical protein